MGDIGERGGQKSQKKMGDVIYGRLLRNVVVICQILLQKISNFDNIYYKSHDLIHANLNQKWPTFFLFSLLLMLPWWYQSVSKDVSICVIHFLSKSTSVILFYAYNINNRETSLQNFCWWNSILKSYNVDFCYRNLHSV